MQTPEEHELQTYSLFIHPLDLKELRRDIWCDEPLPAKLKVGQKQIHVELAYRGFNTRKYPKKSYHVRYLTPATFQGGREIHLNAEYIDASLIRNKLSFDFFQSIGAVAPDCRHVVLKINGLTSGVYLQLESVDDLFLQKRGLSPGAIWYAVDDDANFSLISPINDDVKEELESGYQRKIGMEEDDEHLRELIYQIGTIKRADFGAKIQQYVNVEAYLHWLVGVVCTQNFDAFVQNYALYRNGETGQFQIIPWDYDGTWGRDCHGHLMEYDYIPITGYNTLTARLLDVPEFRRLYKELFTEILETKFRREVLEPHIQKLYHLLRPQVVKDPYLGKEIHKFDAEYEMILQFIDDRNRYLREHLNDLDESPR